MLIGTHPTLREEVLAWSRTRHDQKSLEEDLLKIIVSYEKWMMARPAGLLEISWNADIMHLEYRFVHRSVNEFLKTPAGSNVLKADGRIEGAKSFCLIEATLIGATLQVVPTIHRKVPRILDWMNHQADTQIILSDSALEVELLEPSDKDFLVASDDSLQPSSHTSQRHEFLFLAAQHGRSEFLEKHLPKFDLSGLSKVEFMSELLLWAIRSRVATRFRLCYDWLTPKNIHKQCQDYLKTVTWLLDNGADPHFDFLSSSGLDSNQQEENQISTSFLAVTPFTEILHHVFLTGQTLRTFSTSEGRKDTQGQPLLKTCIEALKTRGNDKKARLALYLQCGMFCITNSSGPARLIHLFQVTS